MLYCSNADTVLQNSSNGKTLTQEDVHSLPLATPRVPRGILCRGPRDTGKQDELSCQEEKGSEIAPPGSSASEASLGAEFAPLCHFPAWVPVLSRAGGGEGVWVRGWRELMAGAPCPGASLGPTLQNRQGRGFGIALMQPGHFLALLGGSSLLRSNGPALDMVFFSCERFPRKASAPLETEKQIHVLFKEFIRSSGKPVHWAIFPTALIGGGGEQPSLHIQQVVFNISEEENSHPERHFQLVYSARTPNSKAKTSPDW